MSTNGETTQVGQLPVTFPAFYKEGHRGARGSMPENTIPAMLKGLEMGANVLEMDVYTAKDGQVVVAHDPYINPDYSLLPDGTEIPATDARRYILHQMNYAEIRQFDTGSKYYSEFPQQQKIHTYTPLLNELIDAVELYVNIHHLPKPIYNIELKTDPQYDDIYNASPTDLVEAVMAVVKSKSIQQRCYLQSFDFRPLKYLHERYPDVVLGFLTETDRSFEDNIKELGFYPAIYSPFYEMTTEDLVKKCHEHGLKFIPWTVNSLGEMERIIALGADGIITDYPNLFDELGK